MERKTIGVLPLIDDERESYWMLPGYMEGIMEAGGIPLMLPPTTDTEMISSFLNICDGFLFTGGHDVSPALYHEERSDTCAGTSELRDFMETELFRRAYKADKPMLGICRGIQFMNAVMGGTLYQDLPTQFGTRIEHHQTPPYDLPAHRVTIVCGSPLYDLLSDLLKRDELCVNSYHHQAVKDLAPGLLVMAVSEDGLIEAIQDASRHFVWAVQWHPEFSYKKEESSRRIFRAFVESCDKAIKNS